MKNRLILKFLVPLCFLVAALLLVAYQHSKIKEEELLRGNGLNHVVIELFTSQDCKKCADADALIASLKDEQKVIALTYPVSIENNERTESTALSLDYKEYHSRYGRKFRRKSYTPELILNGKEHFAGQGNHVLNGHLRAEGMIAYLETPFVYRTNTGIHVTYSFDNSVPGAQLYALLVQDSAAFTAPGETRKKTIFNNLVLEKIPLDVTLRSGTFSFQLPESLNGQVKYKVVLLLQNAKMEIKAASISKSC